MKTLCNVLNEEKDSCTMNNHIVCRYMKSLGMDPIKVNVLVDKDSP